MKFFALLIGMFLLLPAMAAAQVIVNPAALQQLAGITAAATPVVMAQVVPPVVHRARHRHFAIMLVRPATPLVAPMVAKPAPPKPVRVVARVPLKPLGPSMLTFADGSAALPASAPGVLKPYCKTNGVLMIDARAAGDPSDPSIAMRLALARAMAVRDALVGCGVPAQKIIPRALGSVPGFNNDDTQLAPAP